MADYADRLSAYPNKGVCGLAESIDPARVFQNKIKSLAQMIRESKHTVIMTGAGISTSAGIPDFRGPKGVWTLEKQHAREEKRKSRSNAKKRKLEGIIESDLKSDTTPSPIQKQASSEANNNASSHVTPNNAEDNTNSNNSEETQSSAKKVKLSSSFEQAKPTLTHNIITKLIQEQNSNDGQRSFFHHCITQNVDGLHRRSGLSRDHLSILHGCVFTEQCKTCNQEYFRDFDVGGVSFQPTGRKCTADDCDGDLIDTILDWNDELPERDYGIAMEQCTKADLCLALGTSLRIEPAGSLPLSARKFVIVNLQVTPKDQYATLIIRSRVDEVMKALVEKLYV